MPYYIQNTIQESECIGDSLTVINNNYVNLDTALATTSAQNLTLKAAFNTLVRSLTSVGSPGTTYNSLSTVFQGLSAFVLS